LPVLQGMEKNDAVRRGMLSTSGATLLFAVVHSLLASHYAKQKSKDWLGERRAIAWYRVFYNAQALLTTGALFWHIWRQPSHLLYEAKAPLNWLMRGGQLLSVIYALRAARHLPLSHFSGLPHLLAYRKNEPLPREAEGQGPTIEDDGALRDDGPFKNSRHPLNLAPLGVFWLQPKMTSNWLLFCVLSTLYALLGSAHEEARFVKASPEYKAYQGRTPFLWPRLFANKGNQGEQ
jgi:methanethiol S-methyltransferase